MLVSHSKTYHPGRPVLSSGQLATLVDPLRDSGYRTSTGERYHQAPGQKPVDGLEVLSGFSCPLLNDQGSRCSWASGAESSLTRHLSDHQPQENKPKASSCVSHVQTLFTKGGLKRYFSVDPSLSNLDPSSTSAYAYAVEMLGNLPKPEIPIPENDKDRASIHWFTRWPQLLGPYITDRESIDHLQSLVAFPGNSDPDWLTKLLDHGSRWWKDTEASHISCPERVSIMLKSHQR